MKAVKSSLWAGDIEAGLKALAQHRSPARLHASAPESVGLFVFKGDLDRANIEFEQARKQLKAGAFAGSLFYLLVGAVRKSQYARAISVLRDLRTFYALHRYEIEVRFYFCQALSFFFYYRSDYSQSRKWAERALRSSLKMNFAFGELIARDLLGGCLVAEGAVSHGLDHLRQALSLAERIGNGGFASTLRVSLLGFECRFGRCPDPVSEIQSLLRTLKAEDTYSLSDLKLELSRQLILRGRMREAEQVLNECSTLIYSMENKRQSSTLHHRLAFLMCAKGQYQSALTFLQVAEQSLHPQWDKVYLSRLAGLRVNTLRELRWPTQNSALQGDFVHSRIGRRGRQHELDVPLRKGEDPLGDFLDEVLVENSLSSAERLLRLAQKGLWYFALDVLELNRDGEYLILGIEGASLTLFSNGEVVHVPRSHRGLGEKFLLQLSRGLQSKESLIQGVWGYRYEPYRHDTLIYSLTAQLRKQFGPLSSWIEMTDDGYRLRPGVQLLDRSAKRRSDMGIFNDSQPLSVKAQILDPRLNFRQSEWIELNGNGSKPFSISMYRKHFGISTMTAFRDIQGLQEMKWLVRSGFGRATRYTLLIRLEA